MNTINALLVAIGLGTALSVAAAEDISEPAVPQQYLDFARDNANPKLSPSLQKRLIDINAILNSPEHRAMNKDMELRAQDIMAAKVPGFKSETPPTAAQPVLSNAAVLFVSESIPIDVLRLYAKDLAKVRGVMVFRGMKNGLSKIGPMVKFIGDITKVDRDCRGPTCANLTVNVVIDPQLFRDNSINAVPALAFLPQMQLGSYCSRGEDAALQNKSADIVYGDASLAGMLKAMNSLRRDTRIEAIVNKLEGV